MQRKRRKYCLDHSKRPPKEKIPKELKKRVSTIPFTSKENKEKEIQKEKEKKGMGYSAPATPLQKSAASAGMSRYWDKVHKNQMVRTPWTKHGAYSFINKGKIPGKKRKLVDFVSQERYKWIEELGGEDSLTYMEMSLIDEATRLLLYCIMVTDYLIKDKDANVMYRDKDTGEIKMHGALSRNYLSFTKTYISILKELNKLAKEPGKVKKRGKGRLDPARFLKDAYKFGEGKKK